MKKLATSTILILSLTIAATYSAWAYFTNSVQQPGNILGTATLDIIVNGETDDVLGQMVLENIAPGWDNETSGTLENNSTVPTKIRLQTTNHTGDWDELSPYVNYTYSIYSDEQRTQLENETLGTLSSFNNDWNNGYTLPEEEATYYYTFSLELDETQGNEAQGKTANFDLTIEATQDINSGWGE